MMIVLGAVILSLICIIAGVITVVRALHPVNTRIAIIQTNIQAIPIAQGLQDITRLQAALDGLQTLLARCKNGFRKS